MGAEVKTEVKENEAKVDSQKDTETKETTKDETKETVETKEDKGTATDNEQKEQKEEKVETTETNPDKDENDKEDTEDSVDVDKLLEDIENKDVQVTTLKTQLKKEQDKVASYKEQVKNYEKVISSLVENKLKQIPEEYHALVPEGDSVSTLDWLNKAEESGIFNKAETPDIEIGKPLKAGNPKEKAQSNLTAQQKISNYFSNYFRK